MPKEEIVAGVDGCRGGWVVVTMPKGRPAAASIEVVPTFAEVVAGPARMIAVDMPIGLPERAGTGGRPADVAARANLGRRKSALFSVPSRAAVGETTYERACLVAAQTSDPPRKVSKQCFCLFGKIREVDALMTPALQDRVFECHPELAFWALNGERPIDVPKKSGSRPHEQGLAQRRRLLIGAGLAEAFLIGRPAGRRRNVGQDDILDACVCAWSAARIAAGGGRCFPEHPPRDARGLRMEIRV